MSTSSKLRATVVLSGLIGLGGCAHRDAVDTVDNWWHQYEGGVIAQQRLPPPGAHGRYPHVGLTPTQPVDVPSADARTALTQKLTLQRNYGQRIAAADGPLVTTPPPPPPKPRPAPLNDDSGSSMSVTAPGDTSSSASPSTTGPKATAQPAAAPTTTPGTPPEAAMPAVTRYAPPPIKPGEIPQMDALPPAAPQFPGFDIPRDASLPDRPAPAYDLSNPHGTLIRFAQASDQILKGQDRELSVILNNREPHSLVYVKGFGEASSLRPEDQAASIRLGLLRARNVAEALILRGIPGADIRLSAGALGQGARIDKTPY